MDTDDVERNSSSLKLGLAYGYLLSRTYVDG